MEKELLKQVLNNKTSEFQKQFASELKEALENHPKILKAAKLSKIYEKINSLNAEIKDLLREAKLVEAEGSDAFDDDSDSIGIDPENDNVEYTEVDSMTNLLGVDDPNAVPDVTPIPESEWNDIFKEEYNPEEDETNITDDAELKDETNGLGETDPHEVRLEKAIGTDSTNDNVEQVKVFDGI